MPFVFKDVVTTEDAIRTVLGMPGERVANKAIHVIDEHCRVFIAKSPFMVIASSDAQGHVDISPKGDPAGFVKVLDEHTLAIPDRLGNRRADTLRNIVQNPQVGLFFMIPGIKDTLRVSGQAMIVADVWLREQMMMKDKMPDFAIVVKVEEAFVHCAKCIIRSDLWAVESLAVDGVPSLARMLIDHAQLSESEDEMQTIIDDSYRDQLY